MEYFAVLFKYSWMMLIVVAGAIVNLLKHLLESKQDEENDNAFSLLQGAYITLGSLFSGSCVGLISTHFIDSTLVIGGLAGLAGYLGVRGLEEAFDMVVDWMNAMIKSKNSEDRKVNINVNNNRRNRKKTKRAETESDDWGVIDNDNDKN